MGTEEYGLENMENKNFGQNRVGICHEGSQGQTLRGGSEEEEGGGGFV
jgi:hypothetical protein